MPATPHVVSVIRAWKQDQRSKDSAARAYTVEFDDPAYALLETAMTATDGTNSIPLYGSTYDENALLIAGWPTLTKRTPCLIEVICQWRGWSSPSGQQDPTLAPDLFLWETETVIEPTSCDQAGAVIANTNGEAFDPPPAIEHRDQVVTIIHNMPESEASTAIGDKLTYERSINSADVTIDGKTVAAGLGRITGFQVSQEVQGTFKFRLQTIRITIRPLLAQVQDGEATQVPPWKLPVQNRGNCDDEGRQILDANGNPVYGVPLDSSGIPIPPYGAGGDPHWCNFDIYPTKAWGDMDVFAHPNN